MTFFFNLKNKIENSKFYLKLILIEAKKKKCLILTIY